MPSHNTRVVKHIVSGTPGLEHHFIPNYSDLSEVVKILKNAGYKIVLTQGVYDLFHVGHKRYLEGAKGHGDILIVGVDTDELTKKRKGPKRPFDKFQDRIEILSSLRAVDIVTVRNDKDHMYKLIKLVKPDVLIMSQTTEDFGDTDRKNLLHYCGDIEIMPAQASTTTTAKLRQLMVDGVEQLGQRINLVINDFLTAGNENSRRLYSSHPQRAPRVLSKGKTGRSLRSR